MEPPPPLIRGSWVLYLSKLRQEAHHLSKWEPGSASSLRIAGLPWAEAGMWGQGRARPTLHPVLSSTSHHVLLIILSLIHRHVSPRLSPWSWKRTLKMKAFIETGHQEGKQNTWCSLKTLCTSMSCLEYCPLSNPMFCSKPMSSSVTNILLHALSLPPVQRLSVRSCPLGPFEWFLIRAVIKVNSLVAPLVTKPGGSANRAHRNAVCSSIDLWGLLDVSRHLNSMSLELLIS